MEEGGVGGGEQAGRNHTIYTIQYRKLGMRYTGPFELTVNVRGSSFIITYSYE